MSSTAQTGKWDRWRRNLPKGPEFLPGPSPKGSWQPSPEWLAGSPVDSNKIYVGVADGKMMTAWPDAKAEPAMRRVELIRALRETYPFDAYMVSYHPSEGNDPLYHRIIKNTEDGYDRRIACQVLIADYDMPGKKWKGPAEIRAMHRKLLCMELLAYAAWYFTNGGLRIVQPYLKPCSPFEHELYLLRWLRHLIEAGIAIDMACKDWTRFFRLARVRRDHAQVHLKTWFRWMKPIDLGPLPPGRVSLLDGSISATGSTEKTKGPRRARAIMTAAEFALKPPAVWHNRIEIIAAAVKEEPEDWHELFLALSGGLLARGAFPEHLPAIIGAISVATGNDDKTHDRVAGAKTTVQRAARGVPYTGYSELRLRWPRVAAAVDQVMATGREAAWVAELNDRGAVPEVPDLQHELSRLSLDMELLDEGLFVVSAECGAGKTEAIIQAAIARATRQYTVENPTGRTAPWGSKTAIAVPTHELAKQLEAELVRRGVPVIRIMSPLRVEDEHGQPVCRYHAIAQELVSGGLSMQRLLCHGDGGKRCPYFDECSAKDGMVGPPDARIAVGPYQLMPRLLEFAGKTGLLAVDEPPPPMGTIMLTMKDLGTALDGLEFFANRYAQAMLPTIVALRAALARGVLGAPAKLLPELVADHAGAVSEEDLEVVRNATELEGSDPVAFARAAYREEDKSKRFPPVRASVVEEAKVSTARAREVGAGARVVGRLHQGVAGDIPVKAQVIEDHGERKLLLSSVSEHLSLAITREAGATWLLDAGAAANLELYRLLAPVDVHYRHVPADDGAEIARTMLWCTAAARSSWCPHGRARVEPSLIRALRKVFEWAAEKPGTRTLALITFKPLEALLRVALAEDIEAAAKEHGVDAGLVKAIREQVAPIVRPWRGRLQLGHYGALRGLNHMADADALVTLGDSRPNLDAVKLQVALWGAEIDWEGRVLAEAKAELEQAQGRLRVVHRKRPGRVMHVGTIVPGGFGWTHRKVEARRVEKGGPVGREEVVPVAEVRRLVELNGGRNVVARSLGVSERTVGRWLEGTTAIPQEDLEKLR